MISPGRILDNIDFSLRDMRANPTRTLLSLIGVTIGIFCIIMVKTLVDSLSANISNSLSSLGGDVVYVSKFAWVPEDRDEPYPFWKYLARPANTFREYKILQQELKNIDALAICYAGSSGEISFQGQNLESSMVFGATQDFGNIQSFDIAEGRYFSPQEADGQAPVVIVGANIYDALSDGKDMIGQQMRVYNKSLRVIGRLKKKGDNLAGFDFDNGIIIPYKLADDMYNFSGNSINSNSDPLLMVKAKNSKAIPEVEDNITATLRRLRQLSPGEENNFSFNRLSTLQKSVDAIFISINIGGVLIGGFAMLIGLFGIANIMFVSVRERTPMIGLQKALGARKIDILVEFMSESIILCLLGGILGLVFIYIVSTYISNNFDFAVTLTTDNIILGLILSISVGFLAGIIPSNSAAKMKPVDAIRFA